VGVEDKSVKDLKKSGDLIQTIGRLRGCLGRTTLKVPTRIERIVNWSEFGGGANREVREENKAQ